MSGSSHTSSLIEGQGLLSQRYYSDKHVRACRYTPSGCYGDLFCWIPPESGKYGRCQTDGTLTEVSNPERESCDMQLCAITRKHRVQLFRPHHKFGGPSLSNRAHLSDLFYGFNELHVDFFPPFLPHCQPPSCSSFLCCLVR